MMSHASGNLRPRARGRALRLSVVCCLLAVSPQLGQAAIGDKAPTVPSTYVSAPSRIGAPDNAYLDLIWAARPSAYGGTNGAHRIWDAADAWVAASPTASKTGMVNFRYLLMAYLAEKRNSGSRASTYLTKIQDTGATVSTMGAYLGGWSAALAYSWIHDDLGSTALGNYRSAMYTWMNAYELNTPGGSPYNDQFWITGTHITPHLVMALAIYPDDSATSLPHLKWSMDLFKNYILPIWKQVMGGEYGCGASAPSSNDCGGGWHEEMVYQNTGNDYLGMTHWFFPYLLAWKNATGEDLFSTEPWVKNYAYQTAYRMRPDYRFDLIGLTSYGVPDPEYASGLAIPASLNGLAEVFNEPALRQWARTFNQTGVPDGFEPSGWPYYSPDNSGKTVASLSTLAKVKNFPGWGTIFFRTNAPNDEDGTYCWLRYGDNFWSHAVQDAGAFSCFNRGELNMRSGTYRAGTGSSHQKAYVTQAISENTLTIYNSAESYPSETFAFADYDSGGPYMATMPNDGGQRRVGSDLSNAIGVEMVQATNIPLDRAQWERARELYHMGNLLAFTTGTGGKWAYAAVDITAAYNNLYSIGAHTANGKLREANSINRTLRAQKVIRHFVWLPRAGSSSTSAYVVIFDQVTSTDSSFVKKNILHFVNSPTVSSYSGGTKWTATRTGTVTGIANGSEWPAKYLANVPLYSSGSFDYTYNGKTYGWMTMAGTTPGSGTITTVGGAGHQFDINGVNYNKCLDSSQCGAADMGGDGFISPLSNVWTSGLGSWRLEQSPTTSETEDWFQNLILYTTASDTNVVSTEPSASISGGNSTMTWKDAADGCTWTITLPLRGHGVTVSAAGAASTCPGI